jgi:hypothetical protein
MEQRLAEEQAAYRERHPQTPEHEKDCYLCQVRLRDAQEYGGLAW